MQYLQPLLDDGIDTLVLGCTHYPLLRAAIGHLLGDEVSWSIPPRIARVQSAHSWRAKTCRRQKEIVGNLRVALTDPPDDF